MGNQIKFSPEKKREDPFAGKEDSRALEIKNIELKNTNRKLISKIDQQKNIIKELQQKLLSSSDGDHHNNPDYRKDGDYQKIKKENQQLKRMLDESKKEIIRLNNHINDLKSLGPWNILKK